MLELRPYQQEMLSDIHVELGEHQSVLAVLPTGGGKTVIFTKMGQGVVSRGKTAWFLAHRDSLIDQISGTLLQFGVPHGFIRAGMPLCNARAKVGMVQSVRNRLHLLEPPDLLVIDECHRVAAKTYAELHAAMPQTTSIVGFTGSPWRRDGKGLGNYFTSMVNGPGPAELISLGYLVKPRVYAPVLLDRKQLHISHGDFITSEVEELLDRPSITGDAVEHWKKYAPNLLSLYFCVSIEHAKHVAQKFRDAGIAAAHVDGTMSKDEIRAIFAAFRRREILFLASVDLVSEGVDIPMIEAIGLLRPTESLTMYLQQVGRGLRLFEGKFEVIVLDHVGNVARHGMPDQSRDWSDCLFITRDKARKDDPDNMVIHTCTNCYLVYEGNRCPDCPPAEKPEDGDGREIEVRDGELVEIKNVRSYLLKEEIELLRTMKSKEEIEEFAANFGVPFDTCRNVLIARSKTFDELQAAGRALGYKAGWATHRFKARGGIITAEMVIS